MLLRRDGQLGVRPDDLAAQLRDLGVVFLHLSRQFSQLQIGVIRPLLYLGEQPSDGQEPSTVPRLSRIRSVNYYHAPAARRRRPPGPRIQLQQRLQLHQGSIMLLQHVLHLRQFAGKRGQHLPQHSTTSFPTPSLVIRFRRLRYSGFVELKSRLRSSVTGQKCHLAEQRLHIHVCH